MLADQRRLLHEAFERNRGYVVDSQGDSFFVAFATAGDAVAAAAEAQRALAEHDWPGGHEIRVRIGVHTGEPRVVDGGYVGARRPPGRTGDGVRPRGPGAVSESTRALLDDEHPTSATSASIG